MCGAMLSPLCKVPFLKEAVEHQMEHPQASSSRSSARFPHSTKSSEVSAFVTGLRSFFSMDYVQAGLFLTNDRFFDFWKSSNLPALVAQLLRQGSKRRAQKGGGPAVHTWRCEEVRLIVDQLNVNPHCPPPGRPESRRATPENECCLCPALRLRGSRSRRSSTPMRRARSGGGSQEPGDR